MANVTNPLTADQMLVHLQAKSVEDADFRNQLIADPKAVIASEFGIEVPEEFNVQVHENSLEHYHVVLPLRPELHEEQMETIGGGMVPSV